MSFLFGSSRCECNLYCDAAQLEKNLTLFEGVFSHTSCFSIKEETVQDISSLLGMFVFLISY